MPTLILFAAVGLALIALLFIADAKLENVTPIITSDRVGLPAPWHPDTLETPLPLPYTALEVVAPTQSKQEPETQPKIESVARAARAEAPPRRHSTRQRFKHQKNRFHYLADRFSIRGQ